MGVLEITAICMSITEIVKRAIPKNMQDWFNPLLSLSIGIFLGYAENGVSGIQQGIAAGATAVAGYKIPKELSKKGVKDV